MRLSRKAIAKKYAGFALPMGEPAPCFTPDFSQDNMLYEEIDSLNEISVAQSKSSLKDICAFRLKEMPAAENLSVNNDEIIFDNICPKGMDVNQLLEYAHRCEYDVKHQFDNDDN